MGDTILLRRGTKANLPALQAGEPGWAEDANQLFIGTSTGSAASAMPVGDYDYCPESFTQASIETTLALIGTSNKVTLLIRPGTWPIISNADWSAYTNVTFKIVPGAVLQIATGTTTIIPLMDGSGLYQRFNCVGTGQVVFASGAVKAAYPQWWGGSDFGLALQGAINSTDKVVITPGTHTFTVAHYAPGDISTFPLGVYLKNNSHIVIEQGATVTQASGLKLRVFFAGNVSGTNNGIPLDNINVEVHGMIDGNYTNQGYPVEQGFQACPIGAFAKNSNFPLVRAQNYGRYGALYLAYGPHLNIGHVFAQNSHDVTYGVATGVWLESAFQVNIDSIIGENLNGTGLYVSAGGGFWNVSNVQTKTCSSAIGMSPGTSYPASDLNFANVISVGDGTGIYIEVYDPPFLEVRDIAFGQVNVSKAIGHGIQISALELATGRARRITFGSLILKNNAQNGLNFAGGIQLLNSDNVKIGSIIAYDDQTPKTQAYGIRLDANDTNITVVMGDLTGNSAGAVTGYNPIYHHISDVVGFKTENSGTSAAIASGATIAHGLIATPDYVSITAIDTGVTDIYVSAGAANIAVTFTGGGSHQFYWYARTARSN